jgi:hypothetical protein
MIDTQSSHEIPIGAIPLVDKTVKNSRNMPAIIFIENVEDFSEKYGHEQLVEEINQYYR